MCMIVIKPENKKIPEEYLTQAAKHNKDGYGISYHDGEKVVVRKTLELKEFLGWVREMSIEMKYVLHMRNTSAGTITHENAQPLYLSTTKESFCHNGTISSLCGHNTKSDSVLLSDILNKLGDSEGRDDALEAILDGDRACIILANGTIKKYGVWINLDGILYSSDYYKAGSEIIVNSWDDFYYPEEKEHLVFVYGTLKMGYGNNKAFLEDAFYYGDAITVDKYPMIRGYGFPYMYPQSDKGNHIIGEVYSVDDDTLQDLDYLEGVESGHYKREQITVKINGEFNEKVWVYIACHNYDESEKLINEWK